MGVARTLLAQWEQADDRWIARPDDNERWAFMSEAWKTLDTWLLHADLRGSSFDPTSPLYLPVVRP
jgi:hypothetical protein